MHNRQLFCVGKRAGRAKDTYTSLVRLIGPHVSLYKQGWSHYQPNHFSMPKNQEMEYVPIEREASIRRSSGLRLYVARLVFRLLVRSHVCPFCQRSLVRNAEEKVIEF